MTQTSETGPFADPSPEQNFHEALSYLYSEALRNRYHAIVQILELALKHSKELHKSADIPPENLNIILEELTLIQQFRSKTPQQRKSFLNLLKTLPDKPTA